MSGGIRFGPDIRWVEPKRDPIMGEEIEDEFWKAWYNNISNEHDEQDRKKLTFNTVKKYLPQVELDSFQPDCAWVYSSIIVDLF